MVKTASKLLGLSDRQSEVALARSVSLSISPQQSPKPHLAAARTDRAASDSFTFLSTFRRGGGALSRPPLPPPSPPPPPRKELLRFSGAKAPKLSARRCGHSLFRFCPLSSSVASLSGLTWLLVAHWSKTVCLFTATGFSSK